MRLPRQVPLVVLLVLLGLAARPAGAGDGPRPSLDRILAPVRAKFDVPGMAGAVVTSRGLLAQGATGLRAIGHEATVTHEDLWHIGSCTKSMTATLLARLVEKKVLAWDTTLAEALPERAQAMHPAWRGVTVEMLLRNRGGAPHDLHADGLWKRLWAHDGTPRDARRLLIEGVTKRPPESKPGTTTTYSNAGFAVAGHVAEVRADMPFETLLRKELCKPLDMTTVGFGAPGSAEAVDQPRGHVLRGEQMVAIAPGPRADNPPAITPAGRIHLSMADWGRYVAFHLAARQPSASTTFLTPATVARLHAPAAGGTYAMGWVVARRAWGGRVLTHNGSNTMWYAVTWLAPEKDFAVLVACNIGGDRGAKATDAAAWALIQWHLARTRK